MVRRRVDGPFHHYSLSGHKHTTIYVFRIILSIKIPADNTKNPFNADLPLRADALDFWSACFFPCPPTNNFRRFDLNGQCEKRLI